MKKIINLTLLLVFVIGICFFACQSTIIVKKAHAEIQEDSDNLSSFLEFEQAVIQLNSPAPSLYGLRKTQEEVDENSEFKLKRLIVNGDLTETYGAIQDVSYNNLHILVYPSVSATELAYNALIKNKSLDVCIDREISANGYAENEYDYSDNVNWGAEACDIGGYREFLVDNNVEKEVVVVVLDTGINTSHPMFENRLVTDKNGKVRGFSYYDSTYRYSYDNLSFDEDDANTTDIDEGDANQYSFEDDHSHGSHVSGIITSLTPDNVKVLNIKIGNSNGKSTTAIMLSAHLRVLNIYSEQYNIACVNLSFSGGGKSDESERDTFNTQCYDPLKSKGILCTTSAGNDYYENNLEGLTAIVVSASKLGTTHPVIDKSYSDYGAFVDICAPGTDIVSASIAETDGACSELIDKMGTSMASPQVAGVIALLYLNPNLPASYTASDIEQMLYDYSLDIGEPGKDKYYGYGILNLKFFDVEKSDTDILFYRDGSLVDTYVENENFEYDFSLSLECSDVEFEIIYTTDTSIPNYNNGETYSTAFEVDSSIKLYAMGVVIENNEIVKRTELFKISYFDINTPIEECFKIYPYTTGVLAGRLYEYTGAFKNLTIPTTINGYTVKNLGGSLFKWDSNLEKITLPETVANLGAYTFEYCDNLKYVYAPGATTSSLSTFSNCKSITYVVSEHPEDGQTEGVFLPSLTNIYGFTFNCCTNLKYVDLPTVTSVDERGCNFQLCTSLESANLPNIDCIPEGFFAGCDNLTGDFNIGKNVSSIGVNAFYGCPIERFTIDENNTATLYTDGLGVYTDTALIAFATGAKNINYEILSSVEINGKTYTITTIDEFVMCNAQFNELTIPEGLSVLNNCAVANSSINVLNYNAINMTSDGYWDEESLMLGRPFGGTINTIIIGENVETVPARLFQETKVNNLTINSESTQFEINCFYFLHVLNKLKLNFTEPIDSVEYFNMLETTHYKIKGVNYIYSKTELSIESISGLSKYYSSTDGEYYVYSKEPLSEYTITATSNEYGIISPSGTIDVSSGASQTYTFTPNYGCYVQTILVDGIALMSNTFTNAVTNGYTFSNISRSHTISVVFAEIEYTIIVNQSDNGTITPTENQTITYSQSLTFTFTPDSGYYLKNVYIDDVAVSETMLKSIIVNGYTFKNVTDNHTISAEFDEGQASYEVRHWKENISNTGVCYSGKYYSLVQTETLTGAINGSTNAIAKDYMGFTSLSITQETILSDGSTVVNIYYDRELYIVIVSKTLPGIASTAGGGTYRYGEAVTISATLNEGYEFEKWKDDNGVTKSTNSTYSFIMPNNDIELIAIGKLKQFTIEILSEGEGTITPSSGTTVNYGESLTLTISPAVGYMLLEVLIDGTDVINDIENNQYVISNIQKDYQVEVVFQLIKYTITATSGEHGEISPAGNIFVEHGAQKIIEFLPYNGYHVSSILVNNEALSGAILTDAIANGYTIENIDKNYTIYVEFAINVYHITINHSSGGTVVADGLLDVNYYESRVISFICNTGYHVKSVAVNGEELTGEDFTNAINNGLTLANITQDFVISVNYEANTYTMTASAGVNGIISPSGTLLVEYGGNLKYIFSPDIGYMVKNIIIDGIALTNDVLIDAIANGYEFTSISQNHSIYVEFSIKTLIITASSGGNGQISNEGTITVSYGETLRYYFTACTGYMLDSVVVDGNQLDATQLESARKFGYTFYNITTSHAINVTFTKIIFNVSIVCSDHGTVSPNASLLIEYGNSQTFEITPGEGYGIYSIKVNGENIACKNIVTLTRITEDITLEIEFSKSVLISTQSVGNGKVTESTLVDVGGEKCIEFIPDEGYRVKDVKIDNESIGAVGLYVFENVKCSHIVSVEYEKQTYKVNINVKGRGDLLTEQNLENVEYGSSIVFEVMPVIGWKLSAIYVNDVLYEVVDEKIEITDIKSDINIESIFIKEKIVIDINTIYIALIVVLPIACIVIIIKLKDKKKKKKDDDEMSEDDGQDGANIEGVEEDEDDNDESNNKTKIKNVKKQKEFEINHPIDANEIILSRYTNKEDKLNNKLISKKTIIILVVTFAVVIISAVIMLIKGR